MMSQKDHGPKNQPQKTPDDQDSFTDNEHKSPEEGEISEGPPVDNEDLQERRIAAMAYQGPIPNASEFERYEQTLPGAGDRILSMAENTQKNNNTLRRREQVLYYVSKFSAQIIILIIAILALVAGTYLISTGKSAEGIGTILGGLGTLAAAVIWGNHHLDNQENKAE